MKFLTFPRRTAALILFFVACLCNQSVHAQCSSYYQSVYNSATDEIDFTQLCTYDSTIHPVLFMWDFGDGTTVVEQNPSHHYAVANSYLVCLVLYVGNGAGCCQDTFCEQIDYVPASIKENKNWISGVAVNAFEKNVSLHLTLEKQQSLSMNLVTITGRVIPVHVAQTIPKGRNEIDFTMPDYPSGIYLLRIEDAEGNSLARRFMLY